MVSVAAERGKVPDGTWDYVPSALAKFARNTDIAQLIRTGTFVKALERMTDSRERAKAFRTASADTTVVRSSSKPTGRPEGSDSGRIKARRANTTHLGRTISIPSEILVQAASYARHSQRESVAKL
jgi:hypothetical protein